MSIEYKIQRDIFSYTGKIKPDIAAAIEICYTLYYQVPAK